MKRPVSMEYRVTLFKRKLRQIIGAPWLRFEWSIGRCNLIVNLYRFQPESRDLVATRLKAAGIEFEAKRMFNLGADRTPDYLTIPIDQEALPETAAQARYAFDEEDGL